MFRPKIVFYYNSKIIVFFAPPPFPPTKFCEPLYPQTNFLAELDNFRKKNHGKC